MKNVLLDLHVLDLITEQKPEDSNREESYIRDLIVYGQRELYTIYYLKKDLILCKNKERIVHLLEENHARELDYSELDVAHPLYSVLIELSKHAGRFKTELTDDINTLSELPPFRRDKYSTAEIIHLMLRYNIDYLLTLNPFIKLDLLYLRSAVEQMKKIHDLKIRVHM